MDDLSVCPYVRTSRYVRTCVRRSVQCIVEKRRIGSFGIIGRTGPGMRQVVGFGDRSTGRGTFGCEFGGAIVFNGDFTVYMCDSASTVGAAVWGGAYGGPRHCCIRWGSTSSKGKSRFWGFLFSIFIMGNAIGSPTVKCFRFVCGNLTIFPFGKRIVAKLDSWAFWRYIQF